MNNKIVCFHTLNNFSGSPLVLATVIKGLILKDYNIVLYTSKSDGLLSNIQGVDYETIHFKWTRNKIILLFWVVYSQLRLLFEILLKYRKDEGVIFYINTITPWGAAVAGKILGVRIIYHCHEVYVKPNIVNKFSKYIKNKCADKAICVSEFVSDSENCISDKYVVYNSLDDDFIRKANDYLDNEKIINYACNNVLMISSLKEYKGVFQLIKVAELMPNYNFVYVAGASYDEVRIFEKENVIPLNLKVYSSQSDVHPFYQNSDVLINLSMPDLCKETFGMTLLEGMIYGLPVIAPPVGGPIEIVDDGIDGFLVDSRYVDEVVLKIKLITDSSDIYSRMSRNAMKKASYFSAERQVAQIENIITNKNKNE